MRGCGVGVGCVWVLLGGAGVWGWTAIQRGLRGGVNCTHVRHLAKRRAPLHDGGVDPALGLGPRLGLALPRRLPRPQGLDLRLALALVALHDVGVLGHDLLLLLMVIVDWVDCWV